MIPVFLFGFGLFIGSFLNVLGLRWNSGISPAKGRSFCVVCRKDLHWWELIPVISFIGLKGECSECKTKISWQYPLVEWWTALLFSTLSFIVPFGESVVSSILYILLVTVFCIFVVITIYDARHKIIPDELVYSAILIAGAYRFLVHGSFLDLLAGPILFIFFASLWLITRGRGMGFGDAKLALAIGLLLGAPAGFSGVVLAFWIGTVVALLIMFYTRLSKTLFKSQFRITMKSEIPFAPFLILGAWLALIFHLDLFHVLLF